MTSYLPQGKVGSNPHRPRGYTTASGFLYGFKSLVNKVLDFSPKISTYFSKEVCTFSAGPIDAASAVPSAFNRRNMK